MNSGQLCNKTAIFKADRKVALVIGCNVYDKKREEEGKAFPQDIPETMEDV